MVPAYDDPVIWEGHSSMIHEIHKQLERKPHAIFCSVGGGGMLGGILVGCKAVGWDNGTFMNEYCSRRGLIRTQVTICAIETMGSDCFYHSMSLNGERFNSVDKKLPAGVKLIYNRDHGLHLAHFTSFSSKASGSLGASEPAAGVVKMALAWPGEVNTLVVPDELSMLALASFASELNRQPCAFI